MRKWRRMSRWKKWIIGIVSSIILLVIIGAGSLYIYVKSISLDDIKARHTAKNSSDETKPADTKVEVPSALSGSVNKAEQFTTKSIDSQDALDVAAILLNSGLSLKDISYLQGNATNNLSNEEKQRIRDLLLSKLTDEEIELLRSITSEYGKNLVILDPNYPIELVGVYDEKERDWIKKELAERGKSNPVESKGDSKGGTPTPTATTAPQQAETPEQLAIKEEIENKYLAQIRQLQKSSTSESDQLLSDIAAEISKMKKDKQDISLEDLQSKFLNKVVAAEEKSDTKFKAIISEAKQAFEKAGITNTPINEWSKDYEAAKTKARSNAVSKLSSLI